MTDQEKQDARIKAQQYADLSGEPYVDPYPESATPVVETPATEPVVEKPVNKDQLSNEDLIKMLNERAGIKLNSFDDLKPQPTADELREQAEKREANKLAYGLSTGKFKKEDYDAFQQAQTNKMEVITAEITDKITTANPDLTADQVAEQVAMYTLSNLPEDSILRQERQAELILLADSKIKNKYKNIVNLDIDFEQHEQGVTNKTNFENKVKASLPVYRTDLATALSSLRTIEVPVNDTKNPENDATVTLTFSDADIKEVEDAFLHPDQIVRQVKDGFTLESIKEEAETVLLKKHFARLVSQASKNYNSIQKEKYIQGRKGMLPKDGNIDISDDDLNVGNEKLYEELIQSSEEK